MVARTYDHPNNTIQRESFYAAASGTGAKFRPVQTAVLQAAYGVVTTAGTATTATAVVTNGGTGIGTATLGTSTAGTTWSLTNLDSSVASLGLINTVFTSALASDVMYVWHVSDTNTVI